MSVINNNNFASDIFSMRMERLRILSSNIDKYTAELGISTALRDWAVASYDNYLSLSSECGANSGQNSGNYLGFRSQFDDAIDYYIRGKTLLLTYLRKSDIFSDLAEEYAVDGPTPRRFIEFETAVERFHKAHLRHKALGDGYVIPDALEAEMVARCDSAKAKWQKTMEDKQTTSEKYDELRAMKNQDTDNLRAVYWQAVAVWGKYDLRLEELGFAQMQKRRGGGQPKAPEGLRYLPMEKKIVWNASEKATSYQLVVSDKGRIWDEVFEGKETEANYQASETKRKFRVRARNKHGFGKWSETVEI